MRTEKFRDFDRKLSTINKNFSHGLFLSEQFLVDNAQLIADSGEAFSRDIYTNNSYREKFNYRLASLPEHIKEYQKASFISFYVFIYSAFDLYIEDLAKLMHLILPTVWHKSDKENFLNALFRYLNQSEIDTLDYVRLRRNCLVHGNHVLPHPLGKRYRKSLSFTWSGAHFREQIFSQCSTGSGDWHRVPIVPSVKPN
jgi:hypothetical protein